MPVEVKVLFRFCTVLDASSLPHLVFPALNRTCQIETTPFLALTNLASTVLFALSDMVRRL